jgi:flagellar motor switch protein FliN/FliY
VTAEKRVPESWKLHGARHWLVEAWVEGLRRALEATAGAAALAAGRFQVSIPEPDLWSAWPAPLWAQLGLGAMPGAIGAGAPRPVLQVLGRLIAGDPQIDDPGCEAAFLELLNQAASAAAETLSERTGQRQEFSAAQPSSPPSAPDYPVQVEFLWQGVIYALGLVPSPELMETLGAEQLPAQVSVLPPAAQPSAALPANLDLLLEVELPVVVTFGRTQLPLRDVLKLSSGSIVELNRLANEPVEVLINNCVIARGEVVVVDGNYGIRVTEIVSRQERIRSIF